MPHGKASTGTLLTHVGSRQLPRLRRWSRAGGDDHRRRPECLRPLPADDAHRPGILGSRFLFDYRLSAATGASDDRGTVKSSLNYRNASPGCTASSTRSRATHHEEGVATGDPGTRPRVNSTSSFGLPTRVRSPLEEKTPRRCYPFRLLAAVDRRRVAAVHTRPRTVWPRPTSHALGRTGLELEPRPSDPILRRRSAAARGGVVDPETGGQRGARAPSTPTLGLSTASDVYETGREALTTRGGRLNGRDSTVPRV